MSLEQKQKPWRAPDSPTFFTAPSTPLHLSSSSQFDSEFEFRSLPHDEPPPSPKLISLFPSFNNISHLLSEDRRDHDLASHSRPKRISASNNRRSLDLPPLSVPHTPHLTRTPSFSFEEPESDKTARSRSGKKWAFKDLLRRTVPSSKYETREQQQQTMYTQRQSRSETTSPRMTPQHHQAMAKSTQKPKISQAARPPRNAQTPQRSAMAVHYTQQRATELKHRTFLPYRHSLLGGCLGGAFPAEHEAVVR